jgi:hypothetical protein
LSIWIQGNGPLAVSQKDIGGRSKPFGPTGLGYKPTEEFIDSLLDVHLDRCVLE